MYEYAQILAAIVALAETAARMNDEGRQQTNAEDDAKLANVWGRKGVEDARFDAPAAGEAVAQQDQPNQNA
jgi:hypothetical protein